MGPFQSKVIQWICLAAITKPGLVHTEFVPQVLEVVPRALSRLVGYAPVLHRRVHLKYMCTDMHIDMHIDMYIDMYIDAKKCA